MAPAGAVRAVPRPGAIARLQGPGADRDAERGRGRVGDAAVGRRAVRDGSGRQGRIRSTQLTAIAESAAETLATAAGHPLPAAVLTSTAAPTAGNASSTGATAYLALAVGAVLIAIAWAASLRARPPQSLGRRRATG